MRTVPFKHTNQHHAIEQQDNKNRKPINKMKTRTRNAHWCGWSAREASHCECLMLGLLLTRPESVLVHAFSEAVFPGHQHRHQFTSMQTDPHKKIWSCNHFSETTSMKPFSLLLLLLTSIASLGPVGGTSYRFLRSGWDGDSEDHEDEYEGGGGGTGGGGGGGGGGGSYEVCNPPDGGAPIRLWTLSQVSGTTRFSLNSRVRWDARFSYIRFPAFVSRRSVKTKHIATLFSMTRSTTLTISSRFTREDPRL